MLQVKNKQGCIFGLPDSGKSTLTSWILSKFGAAAIIYDTLNEYPDNPFDRYIPLNRGDVAEWEKVTRRIIAARRYQVYAVDEANRYMPSKNEKGGTLPAAARDLNDYRAHYDIGTLFLCRRPVQLNQDVTELSNYLIIFKLDGVNDRDYLNKLCVDLGDAVLNLKPYHFIIYQKGQGFNQFKPVPAHFATDKKMARPS